VDNDGDDSPLFKMLSLKKIDLDEDVTSCAKAIGNNTLFLAAKKNSENLRQQRNNLMKPIMKHLRGAFQFLKILYHPNFKVVGDWGGTITNTGKINYPSGITKRVNVFMRMKKENDSYTKSPSPLLPFLTQNKIDLPLDASNAAKALQKDTDFTNARKKAEEYREKRDNDFVTPLTDINQIGSYLMILFNDNTKALGEYGFDIVDTVKVAKERIINLGIEQSRLAFRTKVGSTMTNLGTKDLIIYKGKLIAGLPTLLKAGNEFILAKGYSIFSVINSSITDTGRFIYNPI
jgi:hypothetical protein